MHSPQENQIKSKDSEDIQLQWKEKIKHSSSKENIVAKTDERKNQAEKANIDLVSLKCENQEKDCRQILHEQAQLRVDVVRIVEDIVMTIICNLEGGITLNNIANNRNDPPSSSSFKDTLNSRKPSFNSDDISIGSTSSQTTPSASEHQLQKKIVVKSHLDSPVTDKCTVYFQNGEWQVCVGSMQGWRKRMEDAHTVLLEAPNDPSVSFFGVFDGHGGNRVSKFVSHHLYKFIIQHQLFYDGKIEAAIKAGFLAIDDFMRKRNIASVGQGSTATIILIKNKVVYCGNVGDSRAISVIDGVVHVLSNDHKPNNGSEQERITKAGQSVVNNRINGSLNMSRALGDFRYKNIKGLAVLDQPVIALPEVITETLTDKWEFIVIACDGIWDVMESREVADFVKVRVKNSDDLGDICCGLMRDCMSQSICTIPTKGCDNMTVVIVLLSDSNTKSSFLQKSEVQRRESEYRIRS